MFADDRGHDNFKDSYSPALGVLVSREFGDRAALYAEPVWVNNTNAEPSELVDDNGTFVVGLGARLRLGSTVYGVVRGHAAGGWLRTRGAPVRRRRSRSGSAATASRSTSANGFGTTFAQMARGGSDDWYIGFNISRKFY